MITSCFDRSIRAALKRTKKDLIRVTGHDTTDSDFNLENEEHDLVLYQLLGTVDEPVTLRLTNKQIYDLRREIRDSPHSVEFTKSLLKKNSLVILGYESRDLYDQVFRELINDLYFYKKLPEGYPEDFYFVNELRYDTTYGLWAGKGEEDLNIISLSPSVFIKKLLKNS